jgi:hypothetical protein
MLSTAMIEALPELRAKYEAELARWDDAPPGMYNIYDNVLVPHLIRLLEVGTDAKGLERLFSLIETLATQEDVRVRELVSISVLEYLISKDVWLTAARQYMGAQTWQMIQDM